VEQELGGRESPKMVRRYAHLAADHLAPYADRMCALWVAEEAPIERHDSITESQTTIA
jgi:hypothetical protein